MGRKHRQTLIVLQAILIFWCHNVDLPCCKFFLQLQNNTPSACHHQQNCIEDIQNVDIAHVKISKTATNLSSHSISIRFTIKNMKIKFEKCRIFFILVLINSEPRTVLLQNVFSYCYCRVMSNQRPTVGSSHT